MSLPKKTSPTKAPKRIKKDVLLKSVLGGHSDEPEELEIAPVVPKPSKRFSDSVAKRR